MADRVLLLTQCLQNDFVRPLGAGERLPNLLHIGREESRRLLGDDPAQGPLARFLAAFGAGAARSGGKHASIHIRDWHDAADPAQRAHLEHFGPHCLRETEGARFVAPLEAMLAATPEQEPVISSPGLSDFEGTALRTVIGARTDGIPRDRVKVAILGVWTDVKVHYLAYDLATRMGFTRIAVPGALVASRSRAKHRAALEHMREMLQVEVIDALPELIEWLELDASVTPPEMRRPSFGPEIALRADDPPMADEERALVSYLFRDSRDVEVARLGGGFSGSRVFRAASRDRGGRREVPHVVKIDTHAKIAKERVAVETVEGLLGAASPRVADFVDGPTLGAIKYGFATMHRSEPRTLLRRLRDARSPAEVEALLADVFRVLERLHQSPHPERLNLFRHFTYRPEYAESTLARARAIGGPGAPEVAALERFYAGLPALLAEDPAEVPCALIHGDLNLANLLLDDAGNCWMIDYFHTGVGPVLQDVAKLENDVRFIAFAADDASGRRESAVAALRAYLERVAGPADARAYAIAGLRYAAHGLSFDECDAAQKRAALAAAADFARQLMQGDATW